jgi:outer membrane protein OmpA-like peptidoglycan-associated protein
MSKAKIFLACLIWLVLLTAGVAIYRLILVPRKTAQKKAEQKQVIDATSGSSNYRHTIHLGLDGFTGYAVLRSDALKKQLRSRGIKLELVDDSADYGKRMNSLATGDIQLAAFPIDALLKSSDAAGKLPATIVAIIDETVGADALVAYRERFPDINSLNSPETKIVFVGDSPSETLVQVLMQKFDLTALGTDSLVPVSSEAELLKRYKAARPAGNEVFATWEPVVSQMKQNDALHVLTDTSQETGFIIDSLVVGRDYLFKNEPIVREFLECYFRALHEINTGDGIESLVKSDASSAGMQLNTDQIQALADGIAWKNTQENFAHFGLRNASVVLVEDMIDRVTSVLLQSGGLGQDPTGGQPSRLYYEKTLAALQASDFHPGVNSESVREQEVLPRLSDSDWSRLVPVGTAQVPALIYARGTSRLTQSSMAKLDELVANLESWPRYYLMIRGGASSRGDEEANRKLARSRAEAALQYLLSKGVPATKMKAMDGELSGQTSVTFVLGQMPF